VPLLTATTSPHTQFRVIGWVRERALCRLSTTRMTRYVYILTSPLHHNTPYSPSSGPLLVSLFPWFPRFCAPQRLRHIISMYIYYTLETPSGFYPMTGIGTPWLTTPTWDILCWVGWFRQYRPCRRRLQVAVSFSYKNWDRKREPTTFHGNGI